MVFSRVELHASEPADLLFLSLDEIVTTTELCPVCTISFSTEIIQRFDLICAATENFLESRSNTRRGLVAVARRDFWDIVETAGSYGGARSTETLLVPLSSP